MPRRLPQNRRGFTLAELLVAMLIVGIIGAAAGRLLLNENRFFDLQTNLKNARRIARSSTNILMSDLRMVQDSGGVDSASADGKLIRLRVPFEFGLVCGTSGSTTTASMLPTDSAAVALAVYAGFATRSATTGRYTYFADATSGHTPASASNPSLCTGNASGDAQLRTVSANGRTGNLLDVKSPSGSGATAGAAIFYWQEISYYFGASSAYSGKIGLYRSVQGGANEEVMAPFDTSARFRFYEAGDDTSRVTPPAVALIRGVDVVLNALSPRAVSNDSKSSSGSIVTSVFFNNVRAY